jgi:acyl-coenzyme A synthetase/AMP-(fatty) acid ligase
VDAKLLEGRAVAWADVIATRCAAGPFPALQISPDPDGVAVLFAALAVERPFVVLSPESAAWPASLLEAGVSVVAPPRASRLATAARERGLPVLELPEAAADGEIGLLRCPAAITFTSGSTGTPKAVCRPAAGLFESAAAIASAYELQSGDGVLATLSQGGLYGAITGAVMASVLDSEATILERFDHRSVIAEFASERHAFWSCRPHMADLLARCALPGPCPRAPRVCRVSGQRLSPETARRFQARFGVPLLNAYATTEHGPLTQQVVRDAALAGPADAGQPLAGVRVAIGERPECPLPPGQPGRVWAQSPWQSLGLGFPPRLAPQPERHGDWVPTSDIGWMDDDGRVCVLGRSDDLFKTPSGHLVSPTAIEEALLGCPEVRAAVALPLPRPTGALVAVVVEGTGIDAERLRRHADTRLPEWARPHVIEIVGRMPLLPTAKVDRGACLEMLERRSKAGGAE